jgi:hypothetical protein
MSNQAKQVTNINVYIGERKTKDGLKKFNTYKCRSKDGKWLEVKFTEDAGKPKADFSFGEKGYVVISPIDFNIAVKPGVFTKDCEQVHVLWVNAFEIAPPANQEEFKAHLVKVREEYATENAKIFESFIN